MRVIRAKDVFSVFFSVISVSCIGILCAIEPGDYSSGTDVRVILLAVAAISALLGFILDSHPKIAKFLSPYLIVLGACVYSFLASLASKLEVYYEIKKRCGTYSNTLIVCKEILKSCDECSEDVDE